MAEIHFRKIQELLGEDVGEIQGLRDQEGIIRSLSIDESQSDDALEIILGLAESMGEGMESAFAYRDDVLYARIYDGESREGKGSKATQELFIKGRRLWNRKK